jgi:hypothetical protein
MGRHEQPQPQSGERTFWGMVRLIAKLPLTFLLAMLALLAGFGILAIRVENAYGDFWGALVSAGIAPFVGGLLLRARLARRHPRGFDSRSDRRPR